jgi:hypothetical protein
MQVTAFSTSIRPEWRWRICDYAGAMVEESYNNFPTIAAAVAQGSARLDELDRERVKEVGRSMAARSYWTNTRLRGR